MGTRWDTCRGWTAVHVPAAQTLNRQVPACVVVPGSTPCLPPLPLQLLDILGSVPAIGCIYQSGLNGPLQFTNLLRLLGGSMPGAEPCWVLCGAC